MTDRFISKQRRQAEAHKLGRVKTSYEFKGDEFVRTTRRADAAKEPAFNPVHAVPVGRNAGVCKPGDEYQGTSAAPEASVPATPRRMK